MRKLTIPAMSDTEVEEAIARISEIHAAEARINVYNKRLLNERSDLADKLAAEFGRRHDWRLTRTPFRIEALAEGKPHTGVAYRNATMLETYRNLFDHPYCYRSMVRPYRAVAVAAHLYNNSADRPGDLWSLAAKLGLEVSWPSFPSWHFPGRTAIALVVAATPRNDRDRNPYTACMLETSTRW